MTAYSVTWTVNTSASFSMRFSIHARRCERVPLRDGILAAQHGAADAAGAEVVEATVLAVDQFGSRARHGRIVRLRTARGCQPTAPGACRRSRNLVPDKGHGARARRRASTWTGLVVRPRDRAAAAGTRRGPTQGVRPAAARQRITGGKRQWESPGQPLPVPWVSPGADPCQFCGVSPGADPLALTPGAAPLALAMGCPLRDPPGADPWSCSPGAGDGCPLRDPLAMGVPLRGPAGAAPLALAMGVPFGTRTGDGCPLREPRMGGCPLCAVLCAVRMGGCPLCAVRMGGCPLCAVPLELLPWRWRWVSPSGPALAMVVPFGTRMGGCPLCAVLCAVRMGGCPPCAVRMGGCPLCAVLAPSAYDATVETEDGVILRGATFNVTEPRMVDLAVDRRARVLLTLPGLPALHEPDSSSTSDPHARMRDGWVAWASRRTPAWSPMEGPPSSGGWMRRRDGGSTAVISTGSGAEASGLGSGRAPRTP